MTSSTNHQYIVVGIDGTGSTSWMKPDGSNSHTSRFVRDFQYGTYGVDRKWFHGPSDTMRGTQTEPILEEALNFVTNRLYQLFPHIKKNYQPFAMFDVNSCQQTEYFMESNRGAKYGYFSYDMSKLRKPKTVVETLKTSWQPLTIADVRLVIIGHSRGGLAATVLAKMLSPIIKVYFLGLYDAVDRQPCLDSLVVDNVHIVYHARRHPDMNSRWYFGNTSLQYKPDLIWQEKFFYTTHGGIGGDFMEDPAQVGFGDDSTCVRRPINQICAEGRNDANRFIREGARFYGLPIS